MPSTAEPPWDTGHGSSPAPGSSNRRFSTASNVSVRPEGTLTVLNTVALCVSLQIGAGLFAAPSQVTQFVPSPGIGVIEWALGGVFVWTGAATFVELGVAIPENGGVQEYLRQCFGEWMGFIFTVTWIALTKPASMGIVSMVFAEYLCDAFVSQGAELPAWLIKAVGFAGLAGLTLINCLGATTGATVANVFFFIKLAALVSVIGLGFGSSWVGRAHGVPESDNGWFGTNDSFDELDLWSKVGRLVTALFGVLYVYGGWESIGFYLGEVRNPTKTLPKAMSISMILCIVGFSLMSAALYVALPMQTLRDKKAVAVELGRQMLGPVGVFVYSLVVSVSSLGSMNSNIFATGRLVAKASERAYFPAILANTHCHPEDNEQEYYRRSLSWMPSLLRYPILWFARLTHRLRMEKNVPIYGMLLNLTISSTYLFLGSFNRLITFVGVSQYFFWFICTVGLFGIRRGRTATVVSTYSYQTRAWNPIIFVFFSGFVVLRGMISDPWQGFGVLGCMSTGWLIWAMKESSWRVEKAMQPDYPPLIPTRSPNTLQGVSGNHQGASDNLRNWEDSQIER